MSGGVEEHPERRTGLTLVLGRAELEHRSLRDVEVVDHDVEMHLLGYVLARPLRGREAVDLLKPQRVAVLGADVAPVVVGLLDLPVEQGAVELGQSLGVGAVQDDDREARDCHERHCRRPSGRIASGFWPEFASPRRRSRPYEVLRTLPGLRHERVFAGAGPPGHEDDLLLACVGNWLALLPEWAMLDLCNASSYWAVVEPARRLHPLG